MKILCQHTTMMVMLLLLFSCGQPPAFVEQEPGSNALPTQVPIGPGGRIDDSGNPVDDDGDDPFDPDKELYQLAQSFTAGSPAQDGIDVDLNNPFIESGLKMKREYLERSLSFTQVNRATITDQAHQGHPASPTRDTFTQSAADRLLDIMLVVDNSGSMGQEQANLASKLGPLLSAVSATDWRIAINTTDPSRGCVNQVIDSTTPNAAALFQSTVAGFGVNGSGNEQGILQAVNGMQSQCLPQPWMRNNSNVAVLIVSDEDNCSNGAGCGSQPYGQASYLSNYLSSVRVLGVNAHVYGIVWHPSQSQAQCTTGAYKANQYASVITGSNGTWGSICAADYTNTLTAISQDIAISLNTQFTLSHMPEAGTVKVYVNGVLQNGNISVTQNIVTFTSNPPAEGATVHIDYEYGAVPVVTQFALSQAPDASTIKVSVNGNLVSGSAYSYNSGTNKIVFNSAPAHNALVSILYRKDDPELLSSFALAGTVSAASVKVKVDGALQGSGWSFHAPSNSVVFTNIPGDNAAIVVQYQEVGGPILAYPFAVPAEAESGIEIADAGNGAPVAFTYASGKINFAMAQWAENRQVLVKYPNPSFGQMTVSLPHTPIASTVVAEAGGVPCSAPVLVVSGSSVNMSACTFPPSATVIEIDYMYQPSASTSFTFTPSLPVSLDDVLWDVTVNGTAVYNYTRTGRVFKFSAPISAGGVVSIKANYYQ